METDEQTLEEIKKWWKEHGRTVIAGVVLGLGTVIGWTTWKSHQEAKSEELSLRYQALVDTAAQENRTDAMLLADAIIADQPESSYAALSALVAAHSAFKNKDLNRARDYLQWAVDNATAAAALAVVDRTLTIAPLPPAARCGRASRAARTA